MQIRVKLQRMDRADQKAAMASEEIAVRTSAGEANFCFVGFVDQKPVRGNMAFALGEPIPDKRMVMALRWKDLACHQDIKHLLQFGDIVVAAVAEFQVALELRRKDERFHRMSFSMASTEAYRERSWLPSRSLIAARVAALGFSSPSPSTIGKGKPRCSRVCMRRTFMPVDVVMPRREKRMSARRLISGLTRNAIVADAMSNCFLLFNNGGHYSIITERKQAGHFLNEDNGCHGVLWVARQPKI